MKPKCDDKEWMHCNVEKMGCDGCHYEDRPFDPKTMIFLDYLESMKDLYLKKNHDYGDSVSKTFDEYGLTSFLVRMDDKMNRIKTLNKIQDAAVRGEKIEDTLLDLANYAILALTEIEFRKKLLLSEPDEYIKNDITITKTYIDQQGFIVKDSEGTDSL